MNYKVVTSLQFCNVHVLGGPCVMLFSLSKFLGEVIILTHTSYMSFSCYILYLGYFNLISCFMGENLGIGRF